MGLWQGENRQKLCSSKKFFIHINLSYFKNEDPALIKQNLNTTQTRCCIQCAVCTVIL